MFVIRFNSILLFLFGLACLNGVLSVPIPVRTSTSPDPGSTWSSSSSSSSSSTSSSISSDASSSSSNTTATGTSTGSSSGSSSSSPSGSSSSKRSTSSLSAPYFVVYNDAGANPAPAVANVKGFNVVIMSFLLTTGAADMAAAWVALSATERSTIKAKYEAAGIKLLVSAFGSTETPTTSGHDATTVAQTMAAWIKDYDVDGIDVDYEDTTAMNLANGSAETWLINFTKALRAELPKGEYILTHAPMAPWMGTNTEWTSGAYVKVHEEVGGSIDWYNVQFYNQGAAEYTTCSGLLTASTSSNPNSALFEIEANGFILDKLVIGKPGTSASASNGYIDTTTLASCLSQAKAKGWNGGAMAWKYTEGTVDTTWITAVRGTAFAESSTSKSTRSPDLGSSLTLRIPASSTFDISLAGGSSADSTSTAASASTSSGLSSADTGSDSTSSDSESSTGDTGSNSTSAVRSDTTSGSSSTDTRSDTSPDLASGPSTADTGSNSMSTSSSDSTYGSGTQCSLGGASTVTISATALTTQWASAETATPSKRKRSSKGGKGQSWTKETRSR